MSSVIDLPDNPATEGDIGGDIGFDAFRLRLGLVDPKNRMYVFERRRETRRRLEIRVRIEE